CWDGERFSVRDKVKSNFNLQLHSTYQVMEAAQNGTLPAKVMITTHPQRWTNNPIEWGTEFVMQNLKNSIKNWLIRLKKSF
ncbi:MAG: hypothetical protein KA206_07095, partial [Paludibacter sp.]|nr:hypothetical protein [Paludibacter sp.]